MCCAEVELDVLTGELQIGRVDITMDQGCPLNPLVDLGQAEGGFVMALGYFLTEEVVWAEDGSQLTLGTWEYKVPATHDIPLALNLKFAAKLPNPSPAAVLSSKASGEPPMALGAAVALAARDAIRAARADAACSDAGAAGAAGADLVLPITVERAQLGCGVLPADFVLK